ncbi:hypothetical protein [Dolichospermum circinale]|uniref:hypothetical protein n=1 Tax=Dolichospermum circinale TaxID=109265 RepID=UPI0023312EFD|nr:hypothetical protein [Dolichospermum circinale]MDB9451465.1 hypothetical protein [Dolichospermum circinale CS-547]
MVSRSTGATCWGRMFFLVMVCFPFCLFVLLLHCEEDWFGEGVKLALKGNLTSCDSPEALYKTSLQTSLLQGERL